MDRQNQDGFISSVILSIILGLALVGSLIFGYWAYQERQTYKDHAQVKINEAVEAAKKVQAVQLQQQFDEQSKNPYKTFTSNAVYGSISFDYPKTWNAYVDTTDENTPFNSYYYPGEIPGISSGAAYVLRVKLINDDYAGVLAQFDGDLNTGKLTASAYIPPKMKAVNNVQPGTRFDGEINLDNAPNPYKGSLVVLKVRDKTLEIYTDSSANLADFNNIILASLHFNP